jgi:adenosylmethionine-8-amino-7-oxononanoate aminotransferase
MVRGEGIYLIDSHGKRYIDGASGSALVCNIGHGVREVAAVLTPQAAELAYNPFHCSHSQAYEDMAERLVRLAPQGFGKVFAVSSGSEAVENAVKFGRQYQAARGLPSKHLVISRWQSYHGNTLAALAYSGYTGRRRRHAPTFKDAVHIPPAFCYRCYFEMSYPSCGLKCARALETAILQEGPENVSAFIAEPVVGAALGGAPAPPGYFQKIREICDTYDVLFIADEVMCGLGRTGANFAIDHWSVAPDLVAAGKGMGSGYFPMAACLVSDKVADTMQAGGAAFEGVHTCCGHLLGSRLATSILDYLEKNKLVQNAGQQGERLLQGLGALKESRPSVGDVRGRGLMCGVEFAKDKASKRPFVAVAFSKIRLTIAFASRPNDGMSRFWRLPRQLNNSKETTERKNGGTFAVYALQRRPSRRRVRIWQAGRALGHSGSQFFLRRARAGADSRRPGA